MLGKKNDGIYTFISPYNIIPPQYSLWIFVFFI